MNTPRHNGFTCPNCGSHHFGTFKYHPSMGSEFPANTRVGTCNEHGHSGNGCTFRWNRDDKAQEDACMYQQTFEEHMAQFKEGLAKIQAGAAPQETVTGPKREKKVVHEIVDCELPSYDHQHGFLVDGTAMVFITNFADWQEPAYREAAETFEGELSFGIGNTAYGFDEDEGRHWVLGTHKAFYATGFGDDLNKFWEHFRAIDKRHNEERWAKEKRES